MQHIRFGKNIGFPNGSRADVEIDVMIRSALRPTVLTLAAALAACTTAAPPAEVTAFHLNQPIARGAITIRPLSPGTVDTLEYRSYVSTVAAELAKLGFTYDPKLATAEQVATIDIQRGIRASALPPRSPVSIGIGGGSFGGGLGVGIGTSFGIGGKKSQDTAVTTLAVQIKRTSDESVVWEGRAASRADADSPAGNEVARLAAALFKDFPGQSGKTVVVK